MKPTESTTSLPETTAMPANAVAKPGYWTLINKGEPYRLLFPLGTAFGITGVMLWVAYVLEWQSTYPGIMHARVMIQGFLGAFAFGFLGTAFPRLTETPKLRLPVSLALAIGLVATVLLHLADRTLWADITFLATFIFFLGQLAYRAVRRADNPPPGFVLVAFGLFSGVFGTIGLIIANLTLLPPFWYSFSALLLYQGLMLPPIMGIGAFLLPRFFALPNRQTFPESLRPSRAWVQRAIFAFACALAIAVSFALEAAGYLRSGNILRGLAVLVYVGVEIPVHRARFSQGSLALALRISLLSVPLGYFFVAAFPQWRIAWLHILFITGFSLITLTVATRVILGHSGQSQRFKARLWPVNIMVGCLIFALLTRISADWMPQSLLNHYAYAAATWVVGAIVWAVAFLPAVRLFDDE